MTGFSNDKVVQVVWLARGIQVVTLAQAVQGVQVEEEENFARKNRQAGGGDYTKLWLLHLVVLKTVILARLFAKKVKGTQINQNNKLK